MIILTWTLGIVLLVLGCFCVFLIKSNLELENRLLTIEYEKFMSNINNDMHNLPSEEYELVKKNTRMLQ